MKKADETVMEYVRRAVSWLDQNNESSLDDLPSVKAAFELFDLISDSYDVSLLDEVIDCIDEGESPKAYNDFVDEYSLPWAKYDGKEWIFKEMVEA